MPHYYYSLNRNYGVSNFSANRFASLPAWQKATLIGALMLPLVGGAAGYMYGGIRHKNKLNELNNRLAKAIDPMEREQIQTEFNNLNQESAFLKRAGLVGAGLVAGSALGGAISKPLVKWL